MDGLAAELAHPLRIRIWELYERDPTRSLAPVDVQRDLAQGVEATVADVNYQLRRLELAGLVGGSGRAG
jgi:hypothetical protein